MSNIKLKISSSVVSNTLPNIVSNIASETELDDKPSIPWIFNIEGIFLGLLGEPPENVTAIALEVDQERMDIDLPENLSDAVKHAIRRHTLQVGDRVRCIGRSRLNFSASIIELKAYCLFTDLQQSNTQAFSTQAFSTQTFSTQAFSTQAFKNNQDQRRYQQSAYRKNNLPEHSQLPSAVSLNPNEAYGKANGKVKGKIMVCHKSGCKKRGGRQLVEALERTLREQQLEDAVAIQYTGCQKQCSKAPSLIIMPGKYRYDGLTPREVPALLKKHFPQTIF
ncbi:MAG: (2Fe-2S) ferredoxin domain-containing protein [Cyanobacteria bacterium J06621_11]